MARLAIAGEFYTSRSLAVAAQSCINAYPEKIQDPNETAKGGVALFGTPGRTLVRNLTDIDPAATPLRGLWTGGGRLFAFAGSRYFELDSHFNLVGSVRTISNTGNYPVQAFGNGNQLLIVSPGQTYIDNGAGPIAVDIGESAGVVDIDGTLVTWISGDQFASNAAWAGTTITIDGTDYVIDRVDDPTQLFITTVGPTATGKDYSHLGESLTGITGAYLNGYFLVNRPSGGTPDLGRQINYSAILDGTNWNGTDEFQKEAYPDYVRSILANNQQLYVFGQQSMQVYTTTADQTVFQPIDGAMAMIGSISPWGPVAINDQVFFIGGAQGGLSAYVLDGFTPKRISTYAVEETWNAASLGTDCVSYAYQEEGHPFWVINFGSQMWGYDTSTGAWHERKFYSDVVGFLPNTTLYHAFVQWSGTTASQHITGGGDGKIYNTSVNIYDDNGSNIKWQRALPYMYAEGRRMFFGRGTLDMETGTVAGGQPEPVISLDYSDDRGVTFSTPRTAGIGTHGQTAKRVYWKSNGSSHERVFRLSGVGKSKVALVTMDMEVSEGTV